MGKRGKKTQAPTALERTLAASRIATRRHLVRMQEHLEAGDLMAAHDHEWTPTLSTLPPEAA